MTNSQVNFYIHICLKGLYVLHNVPHPLSLDICVMCQTNRFLYIVETIKSGNAGLRFNS